MIGRPRMVRPIFSGSMFNALHAVREAFGPLLLDAHGQCGKWGQSVPSSGGSHYFLARYWAEAVAANSPAAPATSLPAGVTLVERYDGDGVAHIANFVIAEDGPIAVDEAVAVGAGYVLVSQDGADTGHRDGFTRFDGENPCVRICGA